MCKPHIYDESVQPNPAKPYPDRPVHFLTVQVSNAWEETKSEIVYNSDTSFNFFSYFERIF